MDELDITRIEHGLYVGADPGIKLPSDISVVVSLRSEAAPTGYKKELTGVLWMPTDDGIFPGFSWLDMILRFIDGAREAGSTVLVHCAAGISRSPFVVSAHLMQEFQMSAKQAVDEISEKRPKVYMLPVYRAALLELEERLKLRRGS